MDKNYLSSKIYHDIRNYVVGISGATRIILENKNKNDVEKSEDLKLIKAIADQSDQISSLIEELLDADDQKTCEFSLTKIQKHNINDLIRNAILNNQYLANDNNIKIVTDLTEDLPNLECDETRMSQILVNTINNAIKYSLKNGEVKISSKLTNGKVRIQISDNGIGMSREEINLALSGKGKEVDKSTLDKQVKSYGIGLPIIKNLVELHQGMLEIESTKGVGTDIVLWFNVESKNNCDVKGKSVLLVEDNRMNAVFVSHVLKESGYKVYHALNGQIALEMLEENPDINLIITDGQMPIMNGYEAAKAIREGKSFKNFTNFNIPIIALMAVKDETSINRAKECGIDHLIDKTVSKSELIDIVQNCI